MNMVEPVILRGVTTCGDKILRKHEDFSKRTYEFWVSRPGGYMAFPGTWLHSNNRIGVIVVVMFKKWFGSMPTFQWHKDGFMAQAWDQHGNQVEINQINDKRKYENN
jgi:hypothetical protein